MDEDGVPLLVDTSLHANPTSNIINDTATPATKVPVTIVTGYLGSGKSTLLKYLTQHNSGKKIAIILNEFGDTADIERSLTVTQDNTPVEEWLELDNGCLCCTAKDAGVQAIENLMKRSGKFDYILLETTGIADPAPIAGMFWLDDALNPALELDGIVTVVDGVNIVKSIATGETARVQLACSDVVVINKCDLLSPPQLKAAEDAVRQITGAATLIHTQFGEIGAEQLLDLKAYTTLRSFDVATAKHDTDITTVAIPLENITTEQDFNSFERKLQFLLWEDTFNGHELDFHRTKARVSFDKTTKIVQGVRQTYDLLDAEFTTEPSKIVFIGRGIKDAEQELFEYFNKV